MKKTPIFRTVIFCVCLLVGLGVQSAWMQSGNLLTNPGFEQPFEPLTDHVPSMVAQGWTPWFAETEPNTTPEYYPATDTVNGMGTPRIHSGSDAQQYFTFFAQHDGGIYQQVSGLNPGDLLSFSAYVYIWSSSGDDANVSDGNGELSVQVGVDPNGGTDATSSAIVWSNPLAIVDQYVKHTIDATAFGGTVTVFIRSTVTKVAMNNVVYVDDAELVVTGTGGEVPAVIVATAEVTAEASAEPVVTEVATTAVTEEPIVSVPTEVLPTEATVEATPEPVVATEVVTEAAALTEAPTEVAPTAAPTEVIPTDVPTEVLPTNTPTEILPTATFTPAPPTLTPLPPPTLDTVTFPFMVPYTVVRGDTVGQLATRFGTTIEAIIIANALGADARIFETQTLNIPVKTLPSPTSPATATTPPTSTPLPTATTPPTEAPVVVQPAASEAPIVVQPANPQTSGAQTPIVTTYIVRYGDSLSSIAARFGVSTRELARANNVVNPNLIYIGQVLQIPASPFPTPVPSATRQAPPTAIPAGHLYQVMRGDNLYRISVRFNVSLADLIAINGIKDASHIFVGQMLIIP